MASDTVFDKKERIRPPRVNIRYDVELNGAKVMKEIPFVVGVLGDLSGSPKGKLPKLKDRKFETIDRDNFDTILKKMKPRLAIQVENKLTGDNTELSVELLFEKLKDFDPENVAKQVPVLNELLEVRSKLKDLLSRLEGNDRLKELLEAIVQKTEVRDKVKDALGVAPKGDKSGGGSGEKKED